MQRAFINELPVEILALIFSAFIGQSEVQHVSRGLLQHVCSLWQSVIDGTPEMWSTVTAVVGAVQRLDIEPYHTQLAKAKGFPLSLHIDDKEEKSTYPHIIQASRDILVLASTTRDILLLYSLVQHHSWRSLSIRNRQNKPFSPFEPLIRHIASNPQIRSTFTSLSIDTLITSISPSTLELINDSLAQTPYLTDLAVPQGLIRHSHPLFQTLLHFRSMSGYNTTTLLEQIREAVLLQSLCVDHVCLDSQWASNDTPGMPESCPLQTLRHLVVRDCNQIPEEAMLRLMHLPNIESLMLERIQGSAHDRAQQFKNLTTGVPWMSQIRSLSLINVAIPEETLLWSLRRLCLLTHVRLTSDEWVGHKIPLALSQQTRPHRKWVCPRLEEIEFLGCCQIRFEELEVLVKARVHDIPNATPTDIAGVNLEPPVRLRKVVWDGRDMIEEVSERVKMEASLVRKAYQRHPRMENLRLQLTDLFTSRASTWVADRNVLATDPIGNA
ncbi:hypothetical protein FRB93_008889 [Tulasnella sp. JGI-2019a]|nr:hypothetical protein FRB93_008889 [Tulasnella sp. JGI-2019a]